MAAAQQARIRFAELVPMSAKNPKHVERLLGICAPYLPQQAWWYDRRADRSQREIPRQRNRARKALSPTGDELPSTVVIEKFEEEPPQSLARSVCCALPPPSLWSAMATRPWSSGTRANASNASAPRVESWRLADAKVFLELWVKVRSGWADDEARRAALATNKCPSPPPR